MGAYTAAYGNSQQMGFNTPAWNQAAQNDQFIRQGIPGYGSYTLPTTPQQTLQQRVFAEHDKAKAAYNAEADGRYNQTVGLYQNLLNPPQVPATGQAHPGMPNTLGAVSDTLGIPQQYGGTGTASASGTALGISQNKFGAGDMAASSPLWGPQAAAMMSQHVRSGLGDSTFGQNQAILSNSMDLANLRQREIGNQFQFANAAYGQAQDQRNFGYNAYQDQQKRTDNLTGQLAGVIASKTPAPPPDITELAYKHGLGNTENSVGGSVAGGGYGGGSPVFANGGYGVPQQSWGYGGSFYSPQTQAKQGLNPTINPNVAYEMRQKQKLYDQRRPLPGSPNYRAASTAIEI